MAKVRLTAGRIANFKCDEGKSQAFLWCEDVPGLAIRVTANSSAKCYIFQAKVKGKSMRLTIGKISAWSIEQAQAEARRLQVMIDTGNDPRLVKADIESAKQAARLSKDQELATLLLQETLKSLKVATVWAEYIAERSASIVDGKYEWGEKHKAQHDYFVQAGGLKRTRGRRPNEPETTRPGILYPLMNMRLVDLDEQAIEHWLSKEAPQAPAATALAFRHLRAFLTWCSKQDNYKSITHQNICQSDTVKKKVPSAQTKKNDSLRRAQIRPWFEAMQKISNPIISAYLQCLLLTGARRNELAPLRWRDVDFQWKSIVLRDKVEGERIIPLTPFVEHLITSLPRRSEFVFSSPTSASGRLEEPRKTHNNALAIAALPPLSLHGLRRSFSTLSEWVEVPVGIVAQIMGHKPSAVAEKHYIQRELDLLHVWHVKIEAWILQQAEIKFVPIQQGLRLVELKAS